MSARKPLPKNWYQCDRDFRSRYRKSQNYVNYDSRTRLESYQTEEGVVYMVFHYDTIIAKFLPNGHVRMCGAYATYSTNNRRDEMCLPTLRSARAISGSSKANAVLQENTEMRWDISGFPVGLPGYDIELDVNRRPVALAGTPIEEFKETVLVPVEEGAKLRRRYIRLLRKHVKPVLKMMSAVDDRQLRLGIPSDDLLELAEELDSAACPETVVAETDLGVEPHKPLYIGDTLAPLDTQLEKRLRMLTPSNPSGWIYEPKVVNEVRVPVTEVHKYVE